MICTIELTQTFVEIGLALGVDSQQLIGGWAVRIRNGLQCTFAIEQWQRIAIAKLDGLSRTS